MLERGLDKDARELCGLGSPRGDTFVVYAGVETDPDGLTDDGVEEGLGSAGLGVSVV